MSPSAAERIIDIQFNVADGDQSLQQIAEAAGFQTVGDMGRWLVDHREKELWRQIQEIQRRQSASAAKVVGSPPPKRVQIETGRQSGKTALAEEVKEQGSDHPVFEVVAEHQAILEESGIIKLSEPEEYPDEDVTGEPFKEPVDDPWEGPPPWYDEEEPTPSPEEEEAEPVTEAPPEPEAPDEEGQVPSAIAPGFALASGATQHRGGGQITYGERIWSYVEAGLKSPKKRTVAKATRAQQALYELVDIVDGEKEEVESLKRIKELEDALAAERAKLRPRTSSSTTDTTPQDGHGRTPGHVIRAWAKENDMRVPERGKLPDHVRKAYEEAHRD